MVRGSGPGTAVHVQHARSSARCRRRSGIDRSNASTTPPPPTTPPLPNAPPFPRPTFVHCLCSRCVPADAGDTDLLGEPGRSGRELAGRSTLETRGDRRLFHAGQGAGGTAEEAARVPSLPGVRDALGERRVARPDHRADDQLFIRTVSVAAAHVGDGVRRRRLGATETRTVSQRRTDGRGAMLGVLHLRKRCVFLVNSAEVGRALPPLSPLVRDFKNCLRVVTESSLEN